MQSQVSFLPHEKKKKKLNPSKYGLMQNQSYSQYQPGMRPKVINIRYIPASYNAKISLEYAPDSRLV
jgi:hypothetical protein